MATTEVLPPTGLGRSVALRQAVELLDGQITELRVADVPLEMAGRLAALLACHERRVVALRTALVRREAEAGRHEAIGGRDPVGNLARLTGTSRGKAKAELDLAVRLEKLPEIAAALRQGEISADQARVIVPAAEADRRTSGDLLQAAQTEPFAQLRQAAQRRQRAARGEEQLEDQERRIHARRYCRTWAPELGGVRVEAWLTAVEGAKLRAALEKRTNALLRTSEEVPERLRADALVDLVAGERVRAELAVRVDAGALVRGAVEGDEVCEVPGVGPISVRAARSLLGGAFLTLLVTRGVDVSTVTSTTRVVPRKVEKALQARDPCCVVPGCGATYRLEIDHWRVDFERTGPTELDNLCRLCSVHHRQKTNGVIVLGGGPGKWHVKPGRMADRAPRVGHAAVGRRRPRAGPWAGAP